MSSSLPDDGRWYEPEGPNRISPRECIRLARDEMTRAYSQTEYRKAVHYIRGANDWMRRALEQMAPEDES